jgi:hypothetical protein
MEVASDERVWDVREARSGIDSLPEVIYHIADVTNQRAG